MSEEMIVRNCSPTLAGMKTGSMFSCSFSSKEEMKDSVRKLNKLLGKKGLRALPLRYSAERTLIYLYRPSRLVRDLRDDTARKLLAERGYACHNTDMCLAHLMRRLSESEDFPHEIGLFLGYPPEDVCGFIENRAACKCVGTWKVYGDADAAQKTFAKYKKCREVYCDQLKKGRSIEQLTVTVS